MRKYLWIYILIAIVAIAFIVNARLKTPVQTQVIESITYEEKVLLSGYMIRDETVYKTAKGGALASAVNEEERVASGTKIATVYQLGIDGKIKEKLDNINEQISRIEKTRAKTEALRGDLAAVDAQIKLRVGDIIKMSQSGSYEGLDSLKEELALLLGNQFPDDNNTSPGKSKLEELKAEKNSLEKQIVSPKDDLYSTTGGVYSSSVDGYEKTLNTSDIKNVTVNSLKSIPKPEPNDSINSPLAPGANACKIVDNSVWMIASIIAERDLFGLKENDSIQIRIPNISNMSIPGRIELISEMENGEAVIVISANHYLATIYSVREIEYEIIKASYTGLCVPMSAMRTVNDKTGVFIDENGIARFRAAEVMYNGNDIAILKPGALRMYDTVIVNGKNIEDRKIIN